MHDSQVFDELLDQSTDEDGNKRAVYADSAYRSKELGGQAFDRALRVYDLARGDFGQLELHRQRFGEQLRVAVRDAGAAAGAGPDSDDAQGLQAAQRVARDDARRAGRHAFAPLAIAVEHQMHGHAGARALVALIAPSIKMIFLVKDITFVDRDRGRRFSVEG